MAPPIHRRLPGFDRRQALIGAVAALTSAYVPRGSFAQAAPLDLHTLTAFIDTLLPADDQSPAASTLNIAEEILAFAGQAPGLDQLIGGGLGWLNQTGTVGFADLIEVERVAIVEWMQRSDPTLGPHVFYRMLRLLAVEFYYARPEAIAGFPLERAPQPTGYPPPWT